MDIREMIEKEFGLIVQNMIVLGQGLDSTAYLVNNEYIFKQSKHQIPIAMAYKTLEKLENLLSPFHLHRLFS